MQSDFKKQDNNHDKPGKPVAPKHPIAAIFIIYNPEQSLSDKLNFVSPQVELLIIINNGNYPITLPDSEMTESMIVVNNEYNKGVATALNQGIQIAASHGFNWAITFDQDSIADNYTIPNLLSFMTSQPDAEHIALIGSNIIDNNISKKRRWLNKEKPHSFFFKRNHCNDLVNNETTWVITSGTLTNIDIANHIGLFQDELFIDLVDMEYCLRSISSGFNIKVCCDSHVRHQVGKRDEHSLLGYKFYPTHHSSERRYYSFRNRVILMKKYWSKFPYWFTYESIAAFYILFTIIVFEDNRLSKLKACFTGTLDGFRNNFNNSKYLIK